MGVKFFFVPNLLLFAEIRLPFRRKNAFAVQDFIGKSLLPLRKRKSPMSSIVRGCMSRSFFLSLFLPAAGRSPCQPSEGLFFSVLSLSHLCLQSSFAGVFGHRNLLQSYDNSATRCEQRGITGIFVEIRGNKIRKFSRSMEKVQFLFHSAHQATTKKNSRFTLDSSDSSRSPNRPLSVRKKCLFCFVSEGQCQKTKDNLTRNVQYIIEIYVF